MNGVAGAYAEHAGMIHIVGMPARAGIETLFTEWFKVYLADRNCSTKSETSSPSHNGAKHGPRDIRRHG